MATIKVTGVDANLARFVQDRISQLHFSGQSEYIRSLIREDMVKVREKERGSLEDILRPLHIHSEQKGYSDRDVDDVVVAARKIVAERRSRKDEAG